MSGRASGIAKSADGDVEAIRALLVARRSARDVRIKYLNQIRHLGFTTPDELRERLRDVPADHLARTAAALRPTTGSDTVMYATKLAIATLGRRVIALEADAGRLDSVLNTVVRRRAPRLLEVYGVGIHTGGNRQANHALWRIVFTRMSNDERTRRYVARRLAEGRSTREIMRMLKHYVAREVYPYLVHD